MGLIETIIIGTKNRYYFNKNIFISLLVTVFVVIKNRLYNLFLKIKYSIFGYPDVIEINKKAKEDLKKRGYRWH